MPVDKSERYYESYVLYQLISVFHYLLSPLQAEIPNFDNFYIQIWLD